MLTVLLTVSLLAVTNGVAAWLVYRQGRRAGRGAGLLEALQVLENYNATSGKISSSVMECERLIDAKLRRL